MKDNKIIKINVTLELAPFMAPDYVRLAKKTGVNDDSPIPLKDVPLDVLNQLCDRFRGEVLEKAGYGPKTR